MLIKKCFLLLAVLLCRASFSQVIPPDRITDWSLAGYRDTVPVYSNEADIAAFGGVGDGMTSNNTALTNAIASLNGRSGTIFFPAGNFRFTASITLRDSLVLKGASADSTTLSFNLGGNGDLIRIAGSISSAFATLQTDAAKDSAFIVVSNPSLFASGDYLKISQNDSALIFSNWAYGSVGQIVQVSSIAGNRINLNSPLRKNFALADSCKVRKMTPKHDIGIECLKVKRLDQSASQTNNIDINYGVRCWIKGVEMDTCNFAHIAISNSSNIEITGCYLHDAFAFGGGGQAYGITVQYTSGECLIENNVFNHLRHAMLLQAGANGNVFGYNSSTNPYWVSGFLPTNSAGDMVLHGNYPFLNLFEGNTGQNIVIDDSHGTNGPFNTFFRNRADLYGIYMNSNPASNNQNFVGNEVTSNGNLQGLYVLAGTGHFAYGNNIKGTITPAGTSPLEDRSYYRQAKPSFFSSTDAWPSIGIPNTLGSGTIPAQQRQQQAANITLCQLNYPFIQYTNIIDTICDGDTYTFNGNLLSSPGIYEDTILTSGGYDSIITLHLTKTTLDTSVTTQGTALVAGQSDAHYQWMDCATDSALLNENLQTFLPPVTGSYRVQITRGHCTDTSACIPVTISGITKPEAPVFSVYPNPANDICTLQAITTANVSACIYNLVGEKVLDLFNNETVRSFAFSTEALPEGLYLIALTDTQGHSAILQIAVAK